MPAQGGEGTAGEAAVSLQGVRVLLADDHPTNRLVAQQMLVSLGASVAEARDGLETVETAEEGTFDVLLVDMEMPRLSGLDAIRHLRSSREHACTPMIALTANVMDEHRRAIAEAGADGMITKPIMSIQRFGSEILEIMAKRGSDGPATAERTSDFDDSALGQIAALAEGEAFTAILTAARDDLGQMVETLSSALQHGDAPGVRFAAHGLAGVAGNIGARGLERLARAIQQAPEKAMREAENEAVRLRGQLDATLSNLERWIAAS